MSFFWISGVARQNLRRQQCLRADEAAAGKFVMRVNIKNYR